MAIQYKTLMKRFNLEKDTIGTSDGKVVTFPSGVIIDLQYVKQFTDQFQKI